ncbi:MAG: ATP-binding protein [Clostridia bacterium]|nr:ATP-binding protein [Clostridia bacterium]
MKEITVKAVRENLAEVLAFLEAELEQADCPMKAQMQTCVAAEEIFVNIASYAYPDSDGSATVKIDISGEAKTAEITFIDRGIPYDPLAKADPDVTLSAEERGIGGLGIFMTKKLMDAVTYEYKDGQNMLTLKKQL